MDRIFLYGFGMYISNAFKNIIKTIDSSLIIILGSFLFWDLFLDLAKVLANLIFHIFVFGFFIKSMCIIIEILKKSQITSLQFFNFFKNQTFDEQEMILEKLNVLLLKEGPKKEESKEEKLKPIPGSGNTITIF